MAKKQFRIYMFCSSLLGSPLSCWSLLILLRQYFRRKRTQPTESYIWRDNKNDIKKTVRNMRAYGEVKLSIYCLKKYNVYLPIRYYIGKWQLMCCSLYLIFRVHVSVRTQIYLQWSHIYNAISLHVFTCKKANYHSPPNRSRQICAS